MTWTYHATDGQGRPLHGRLEAGSEAEARAQLRARQLFLVSLEIAAPGPGHAGEAAAGSGWRHQLARWSGRSTQELAVLTRALASLLEAGIPLDAALDHVTASASSHWRGPFLGVQRRVRSGQSLAEALTAEPALPRLVPPMVAAAEASGQLASTWSAIADHLARSAETATRVRAALVYPAILGAASLVGTTVLLLVVVPRFAALLADATVPLPRLTRTLMAVSSGLRSGGVPAVLVLVGALWLARRPAGGNDRRWWVRLPLMARYLRARDAARYLDTLALALGAGVPLLRAMALARGTLATPLLAEACLAAEPRVRDGGSLADALGGVLPPLARPLMAAGESSGALAEMAHRAAAVAASDAQARLESAVRMLEPLLILGFGGLVGLVALGLLQAVYQLNAAAL